MFFTIYLNDFEYLKETVSKNNKFFSIGGGNKDGKIISKGVMVVYEVQRPEEKALFIWKDDVLHELDFFHSSDRSV